MGQKILASVLGLVVVVFSAISAILFVQISAFSERQSIKLIEAESRHISAEVDATVEVGLDMARSMAHNLEGQLLAKKLDRQFASQGLKNIIMKDGEDFGLFGIWTLWEPNAYDGRDRQFAGKPFHDKTGRFMAYWYRSKTGIDFDVLHDYDTPGAGDYYLVPKKLNQEYITDPYPYPVEGKNLYMASVVVPIQDGDGFFRGVVGVDILLDTLTKLALEAKPYPEAYSMLLSQGNLVAGHEHEEQLAKPFDTEKELFGENFDRVASLLKEPKTTSLQLNLPQLGGEVLFSSTPIYFGKIAQPWHLLTGLVMEKELADAHGILLLLVLVSAAGLVVLFAVLLLVVRLITGPVNQLALALKDVSSGEGDLTRALKVTTGDELGQTAAYFNAFQDKLRGIVDRIKNGGSELKAVGASLSGSMTAMADKLGEISSRITRMKAQGDQQADHLGRTSGALDSIFQRIEILDNRINSQAAAVNQSSASIEQMVANIGSVSRTVDLVSGHFSSLTESSEAGRVRIAEVGNQIREVAAQSEALLDANALIAGIASQTNLLAMNAAIEAAHAGEAGKGFSVVADEIRKLAENASLQSKSIAQALKAVKTTIDQVVQSTGQTEEAFTGLLEKVSEVHDLQNGLKLAMTEQGEGSKEILKALTEINGITSDVKTASEQMKDSGQAAQTEMQNLQSLTADLLTNLGSVAGRNEEIVRLVQEISELADRNSQTIGTVVGEASRFKT